MSEKNSRARAVYQIGDTINSILEYLGVATVTDADAKIRLRFWQKIVTACEVVRTNSAKMLRIPEAVEEKFREEIRKLDTAGYYSALGITNVAEFEKGVVNDLANRVYREYSENPYGVGFSQRYVVPVFKRLAWRVQVDMLAKALSRVSGEQTLRVVGASGSPHIVAVAYENDFEKIYDAGNRTINRDWIQSNVYALVGVHGGKDTHEFGLRESLAYFAKTARLPLILREALALYTAHPDFLRDENSRVILLGEECQGKYVTIHYNKEEGKLILGLASLDQRSRSLLPHEYGESSPSVSYGKPSAGGVIVP